MSENDNKNNRKFFYDLEVWKKSRVLRNDSLKIIKQFPSHEKYDLCDQVKRASRSIPACIAEGHGRYTYKDQIHFYVISRGSATELLNHFIDAFDQHYITRDMPMVQHFKILEIVRMLNGLISYLRKQ